MDDRELRELRVRLKSGEYDGTDIMSAWLALDDLIAERALLRRLVEWDENGQRNPSAPGWITTELFTLLSEARALLDDHYGR